ncbi:MAG: hypothetical protein WC346_15575, partial [Methanogenium sp.]
NRLLGGLTMLNNILLLKYIILSRIKVFILDLYSRNILMQVVRICMCSIVFLALVVLWYLKISYMTLNEKQIIYIEVILLISALLFSIQDVYRITHDRNR